MDTILNHVRRQRRTIIRLIRQMVECESPSGDSAALRRMADLTAAEVSGLASVKRLPGGHLRCDFHTGQHPHGGRILALGHIDTVWPAGTLRQMPFRQRDGRLWGPGVLDMKSGIAFFIHALRALRALEIPVARAVSMLLVTDEETGSATSREITEAEARRSDAVLVLEPGAGLEGKVKTARKGVGDYTIRVRGRAAHSGLEFAAGASAILELCRQLDRIAGFTDLDRGITLNPGVIGGGTRPNVVAAEAWAQTDLRVLRMSDARRVDRRLRALKPFDRRCEVEVTGGVNRPPMERTRAIARLFGKARALARELGVELEESTSGGGSDGNFTAALGIPTRDGLGGVGEGAHAPHESILVERIPDRVALLAKLVAAL